MDRHGSAPSTTGHRASTRVLVVGADDQHPLPPVDAVVIEVATIFEALGEITVATAREPIGLVLLRNPESMERAARDAEALRRVDPSVPIALSSAAPPDRPDAFDAVVPQPVPRGHLEDLLAGRTAPPADDDVAAVIDAVELPPMPAPTEDEPALPEIEVTVDAPPAPVASPEPSAEQLGDVDLVEALLRGETVLGSALDLIRQQTGWDDLSLGAGPREDDDPLVAEIEIVHDRQSFGRLRVPAVNDDDLRPWAAWLARWLELERRYRGYRLMAFQDQLTAAWNRRFFETFLKDTIEQARTLRRPVTVMVFDIDDFKRYNDAFGHKAGDVILVETVRLLNSVIRKGDRVCRIGGDEFAVIFADMEGPREAGSTHPISPEEIAVRFQDQIRQTRFPKLGLEAPGNLSISAGLACFPWDGVTPQQLLECADDRALQSKRRGKNAITLGPGNADR